jgi:capsular polysaccharide biosynthesis protein
MRPIFYITREEVQALQRAFHVDPAPPRPGSILYLSREGYRGDHHTVEAHRSYPSEYITGFMRELGATIVPTREATPDRYRELAGEAETVVADHGSALCNLIFWNTRNVVELFNDSWWGNGFLMLANALGIRDYALVRVNERTPEQIRQQVVHHMKRFGALKANLST